MKEKKEVIECFCHSMVEAGYMAPANSEFITIFRKGRSLYAQQNDRILAMRTLGDKTYDNTLILLKHTLRNDTELRFHNYCKTPRSRVRFYKCMRCEKAMNKADLEYGWKMIGNHIDLCPQCTQDEIEKRLKREKDLAQARKEITQAFSPSRDHPLRRALTPRKKLHMQPSNWSREYE